MDQRKLFVFLKKEKKREKEEAKFGDEKNNHCVTIGM